MRARGWAAGQPLVLLAMTAGLACMTTACDPFYTGNKSTGSSGGGAVAGSVDAVDISACADVPEPRHYAQAAFFAVEEPLVSPDGDRFIERGIVLFGGKTEGFAPFNDLWLLDLTHAEVDGVCPWIHLADDAHAASTFGGTLVYRPAEEAFALIGGFQLAGPGQITASSGVYALDVRDLTAGFDPVPLLVLPSLRYDATWSGSASCSGSQLVDCQYADSCEEAWSEEVDPCSPDPTTCGGSADPDDTGLNAEDLFDCADDPHCHPDGIGGAFLESTMAPGLGYFGAAFDPVADTVELHGGTTGCEGVDCTAWAPLFALDGTGDEHYEAANSAWRIDVDLSAGLARTASASWPRDGAPADWPTTSTVGLTRVGASATGLRWDLAQGAWVHRASSVSTVLYGGSFFQQVAPLTSPERYGRGFHPCGGPLAIEEVYEDAGLCPSLADSLYPSGAVWLHGGSDVTDTGGTVALGALTGQLAEVTAPAMTGVSSDRVLIAGGKNGANASGLHTIALVDPNAGTMATSRHGRAPVRGQRGLRPPWTRRLCSRRDDGDL